MISKRLVAWFEIGSIIRLNLQVVLSSVIFEWALSIRLNNETNSR
jgi:hypothetical protein